VDELVPYCETRCAGRARGTARGAGREGGRRVVGGARPHARCQPSAGRTDDRRQLAAHQFRTSRLPVQAVSTPSQANSRFGSGTQETPSHRGFRLVCRDRGDRTRTCNPRFWRRPEGGQHGRPRPFDAVPGALRSGEITSVGQRFGQNRPGLSFSREHKHEDQRRGGERQHVHGEGHHSDDACC
jgi:hypothetical protein